MSIACVEFSHIRAPSEITNGMRMQMNFTWTHPGVHDGRQDLLQKFYAVKQCLLIRLVHEVAKSVDMLHVIHSIVNILQASGLAVYLPDCTFDIARAGPAELSD